LLSTAFVAINSTRSISNEIRIFLEELVPFLGVLARPPRQLFTVRVSGAPSAGSVLQDAAACPGTLALGRLRHIAGHYVE
jgi:hypothetical protein